MVATIAFLALLFAACGGGQPPGDWNGNQTELPGEAVEVNHVVAGTLFEASAILGEFVASEAVAATPALSSPYNAPYDAVY